MSKKNTMSTIAPIKRIVDVEINALRNVLFCLDNFSFFRISIVVHIILYVKIEIRITGIVKTIISNINDHGSTSSMKNNIIETPMTIPKRKGIYFSINLLLLVKVVT